LTKVLSQGIFLKCWSGLVLQMEWSMKESEESRKARLRKNAAADARSRASAQSNEMRTTKEFFGGIIRSLIDDPTDTSLPPQEREARKKKRDEGGSTS
jgi:hypothetical protein